MADEVRIVIDDGYNEISFCNDFNITTQEEAEAALDNIDSLWGQKLAENPHWAGNGAGFRRVAESTVNKFKSGEFPLPPTTTANGNTNGRIVGQPPASEKSAKEANPPVKSETPEEESEGDGWLDGLQMGLDVAGLAPGVGAAADVLNAGISLLRGDYAGAAFSLFAAIPGIGDAAAVGKMGYKAGQKLSKEITEEAAGKATKEAAEKAAKEKAEKEAAEDGGKSKKKEKDDKDGPCLIGAYGTLKCPKGNEAHHIVPDYTLRIGGRYESSKRIKTNPKLPSLRGGMCICLNKKERKDDFIVNEHKEAHKADSAIRNLGKTSKVPGTVKLSTVMRSSIGIMSIVKPECAAQISVAVTAEFAGIDGDTLVRSDYHRPPSAEAIAVLGTVQR